MLGLGGTVSLSDLGLEGVSPGSVYKVLYLASLVVGGKRRDILDGL
jgi:hypothetical protein